MLNAAALVSGDGAELQSLLDSVFFGEIVGFALRAAISTERGSFALTRGESAHVPGYVGGRGGYFRTAPRSRWRCSTSCTTSI